MFEYYDVLIAGLFVKPANHVKSPEVVSKGLPITMDAKCITLAQYDRVSKDVITAHNLAEYRRNKFNLLLLPDIDIWLDRLIEGVTFTR